MPTLHGFAYSYYNIPKHVLLYKGVSFEEDLVYPSSAGYNKLNPALKVPASQLMMASILRKRR